MVGIELLALALILLYPSDRTLFIGVNMKWLLAPASLVFGVLGVMIVRKPLPSTPDVPRPRQMSVSRPLLGVVIVICLGAWAAYAPIISDSSFLNPLQAERELLRFLETLSKDVLLAGTPCVLDNVPLFAKRQILFSCEEISEDTALVYEALDIYYVDDKQVVIDFCQAHGVDYLVIDLQVYSEEYLATEKIFFEPYHQELLPQLVDRDPFVLAQVPDESKVFQSENLFVVPCNSSLARVK